ncbi:complement C1q-like protein 4 [Saccostrea cucullata]|uniref:complement C1q-like protein 4 n=1 Tax=Saccostrea cuccullata TaxID=36930 RepID=UPI002ED57D00
MENGLDSVIREGKCGHAGHVLVNDGNAYNKATGTFTAPSGGVYVFTWTTLTDPGKAAHPYLKVNGTYKGFTAINNTQTSQNFWNGGSNTIVVRLKKGDKVIVASGYLAAYARGSYSSFSGWKIY